MTLVNEFLSLEESLIAKILYNAKVAQTWLFDLGVTFYITPHHELFLNYSTSANFVWLNNTQEYKITKIEDIVIQLPSENIPYNKYAMYPI